MFNIQEEFEKWYYNNVYTSAKYDPFEKNDCGEYTSNDVCFKWQVWKAACETYQKFTEIEVGDKKYILHVVSSSFGEAPKKTPIPYLGTILLR